VHQVGTLIELPFRSHFHNPGFCCKIQGLKTTAAVLQPHFNISYPVPTDLELSHKNMQKNGTSSVFMRTWFIFLFGWTFRIRCCNVFSVFTCRSALTVASLCKNSTNKVPPLSQKTLATSCVPLASPQPQFSTLWLPYFGPWRTHSDDAVSRKTASWNTAYLKNPDATTKSLTRSA
jgi:hypothetical protein